MDDVAVERRSDRELAVTRQFAAPVSAVFEAWTRPELMRRWWAPASCGLTFLSCEMDVRTGGGYRLVFAHPAAPEPMAFFGTYREVIPNQRLVWTNEEAGEDGAVTTVTFEAAPGGTRLVMIDRHASRAALDEAIASGSADGFGESFRQLDGLLSGAAAGFVGL